CPIRWMILFNKLDERIKQQQQQQSRSSKSSKSSSSSTHNITTITIEETKNVAKESGIEENGMRGALRMFHDLGFILHFQDNPKLKDTIFMCPDEIVKSFRTVITAHGIQVRFQGGTKDSEAEEFIQRGILTSRLLKTLWREYPSNIQMK